MSKFKYIYLLAITVVALSVLYSTSSALDPQQDMKGLKLNCIECHTCPDPTGDDPCLKACPNLTWAQSTSKHQVSEAPDSLLLDKLVDQYSAVHFNHKIHAQMSDMYKGCETCHHFSPPGQIPPCSKCHGGETNPNNLGQPSLKGAYHRQCLCCHREWSHDTKCVICHNPNDTKAMQASSKDSTDIMGISHPVMTVPSKKSYVTPYAAGPMVTFYHQQHIDLFGLRCVDCHQKENCSYCHDINKPTSQAKSQEEVHAICSGCHATAKCDKCHDNKEKAAFTHASTGWRLNKYHTSLSCRACHPTGKMIGKLDTSCNTCHSGWNQTNFQHAVTNLQLDENHRELDCESCHLERNFAVKPDCATCHDDGRTAATSPPGKYLKLSQR
jgi:hypothetical protein